MDDENNGQLSPFLCQCNYSRGICMDFFTKRAEKLNNFLDSEEQERTAFLPRTKSCDCDCMNCDNVCLKECILGNCSQVECCCLTFNASLRGRKCKSCGEKREKNELGLTVLAKCCCRCTNCYPQCVTRCQYKNIDHADECTCIDVVSVASRASTCDDCCYYRCYNMDIFVDEQRLLKLHETDSQMRKAVAIIARNFQQRVSRKLRRKVNEAK